MAAPSSSTDVEHRTHGTAARTLRACTRAAPGLLVALLCAVPAEGRVLRVEIERVSPLLGGRAFGEAGAYDLLEGRIHFGFDPGNPANARVTDIALAPRDDDGLVRAWAELAVLQPVDPARRSGTALVEVVNRGRRIAIGSLNRAPLAFDTPRAPDPDEPRDWGDGFLMRRGLTVIAIGWQGDAPDLPGSLRLRVPLARAADGAPLRGLARADWVVESPTVTLELAAMGHAPIPVTDPDDPASVLTVRDGRDATREVVPRERWGFGQLVDGRSVPDPTRISMPGGFEPGRIYELVYPAQDPPLLGLGFAALRDVIAHARHDPASRFPVQRGIAMGVSQSGRFLRHFLHEGFNVDEEGRRAYDAVVIQIAGAGRGGFNHRFGQPGRVGTRFRNFFYPGDLFPFSSRPQTDPVTGRTEGLLDRLRAAAAVPRIFQVNTGYEYWGRAAALIHVSPEGTRDVEPLDNERLYHIASAPHFSVPFPPPSGTEIGDGAYRGSSIETGSIIRALLHHLLRWVQVGTEPPPSRVPRLDRGSLVAVDALVYPQLPGVQPPRLAHVAYRMDHGPRWSRGIIDVQPPRAGAPYPALVPAVDALGNEATGIRPLELRAPIGTYLPWATRGGLPGPEHELLDFIGSFVRLSRSAAEREARGDVRPPLDVLYPSRAAYLERVDRELDALVSEGFLLLTDRALARDQAIARWEWLQE